MTIDAPLPRDFAPRATIYRGIKMRSRLEAGYATWLDQHHIDWEYEPVAIASDAGHYLADFRLHGVHDTTTSETGPIYVELKPKLHQDVLDMYHALMAPLAPLATAVLIQAPGLLGQWAPTGWLTACWLTTDKGLALGAPQSREEGPFFGEWWRATS